MGHAGDDEYVKTIKYDMERWEEVPVAGGNHK
jgi:hypothetical protein